MGELEDRHLAEERQHAAEEVVVHNKLIDEINEMLPKVAKRLQASQSTQAGYWVDFNGEARIAWRIGNWGGYYEPTGDFFLLPQENVVVYTDGYIYNSSSAKPIHVTPVEYRRINVGELEGRYIKIPARPDLLKNYIGPEPRWLHAALKDILEASKPPAKKKRWWQ